MEQFSILDDEILELLKPIHSMMNTGDYWGVTIDSHAKKDFGLVPLLGDPSLILTDLWECVSMSVVKLETRRWRTLLGKLSRNSSLDLENATDTTSSVHAS